MSDGLETVRAAPVPPPAGAADYDFLWEEYEAELRRQQAYDQEGEDVFPEPSFVLKVRADVKGEAQKVFVNVCRSPQIGPPEMQDGVEAGGEQRLRVPVSCGPPRTDTDKSGRASVVFDVVFNEEAVQRARADREFRDVLAGFAVENIERKHGLQCDRAFKYPKLRFKPGGVDRPPPQRIRKQKPAAGAEAAAPLVQELGGGAEKAKAAGKPRPAPLQKAAAAAYEWTMTANTADGRKKVPVAEVRRADPLPLKLTAVIELPDIASVADLDIQTSPDDLVVAPVDAHNAGVRIVLPFMCDEDATAAKYSRRKRRLTVSFKPVARLVSPALPDVLEEEEEEEEAAAAEADTTESSPSPEATPRPAEGAPAPAAAKQQADEGAAAPAAVSAPAPAPAAAAGENTRFAFENTIMYELCA